MQIEKYYVLHVQHGRVDVKQHTLAHRAEGHAEDLSVSISLQLIGQRREQVSTHLGHIWRLIGSFGGYLL